MQLIKIYNVYGVILLNNINYFISLIYKVELKNFIFNQTYINKKKNLTIASVSPKKNCTQ